MNISCPEMLTNLVNFRYISNYRKLEKGVEPIKKMGDRLENVNFRVRHFDRGD